VDIEEASSQVVPDRSGRLARSRLARDSVPAIMSDDASLEPVRWICLEGVVVQGDGRGRALGYPTANLAVDEEAMVSEEALADGVYAGLLRCRDGRIDQAAVSIGRRPTFYDALGPRLVEAYVLDREVNLYGERVQLLVGPLVRSQRKFRSTEELVAQMRDDVAEIRGQRLEWPRD